MPLQHGAAVALFAGEVALRRPHCGHHQDEPKTQAWSFDTGSRPEPRRGPSTREADLNSCNHSLRLRRKVLQLLRLKQLHNGVFLKAWRLRPLAILLPRQAALR